MSSKCGNVQKVFVPNKTKETEKIAPSSGLEISSLAAQKIHHFCHTQNHSVSDYGLYIKVVKDGCSGKSYAMDLVKLSDYPNDKLFTKDGATIVVDKMSYLFVIGSTLDYVETLLMSGFQLNNPNVKKSCSCGSSFAV